jgi:hypothetical protein
MTAIETKSLKVGKYVDTAHVNTLIRNYKQERWRQNSERLGKEDSLSVWFSVEELEEFISDIKDYRATGVRFYFGAYPNLHINKKGEDGRQTIVMVATKNQLTEEGNVEKNIHVSSENGVSILAYNMGQYCPPTCPSTRKPTTGDSDDWGGLGITIVDKGEQGLAVI